MASLLACRMVRIAIECRGSLRGWFYDEGGSQWRRSFSEAKLSGTDPKAEFEVEQIKQPIMLLTMLNSLERIAFIFINYTESDQHDETFH